MIDALYALAYIVLSIGCIMAAIGLMEEHYG